MADPTLDISANSSIAAKNTLKRKGKKTALEDALASSKDGNRAVLLVRWARDQWSNYTSGLINYRENRRRYEQEAADVFKWRETPAIDENGKPKVFALANDSLNVVASLAEFASAQGGQDLFGGEPWFAAIPVGKKDPKLAEDVQKHLQWTLRDGRLVQRYDAAVTRAACLGEAFTLTVYERDIDNYEAELDVLQIDGKPAMVDGAYVETIEQAQEAVQAGKLTINGKLSWGTAFEKRTEVRSEGIETILLDYVSVAFREDAPELALKHTNFYHEFDLTVLEAMQRFKLSKEDALAMSQSASVQNAPKSEREEIAANKDSAGAAEVNEVTFGSLEEERRMNARVRLIGGFVRVDPFGTGQSSDLYIVFSAMGEERLWYASYLANISPKGELPVKCHVWEQVPARLYGRGFFAKYAHVQKQVDDLWNQISFRNRMHANPITAIHKQNISTEDDDADIVLAPGTSIDPLPGKKLADCIEFAELPDLDKRSMELMQIGIQMAQLRSGISSASQGDMSAVPENNTATGIRQLMSRAAVLLKKPIRALRRSMNREFSYAVRLFYSNFNREETFMFGEGDNAELVSISAKDVKDLDVDVRMLLTQEQNASKLEGSQAAVGMFMQWVQLPAAERVAGHPLFLQAIKALEFDQAEEIIVKPPATIEDMLTLLPPEEQKRLILLLQQAAQAQSLSPTGAVPPQQVAQQPPQHQPQQTPSL